MISWGRWIPQKMTKIMKKIPDSIRCCYNVKKKFKKRHYEKIVPFNLVVDPYSYIKELSLLIKCSELHPYSSDSMLTKNRENQ